MKIFKTHIYRDINNHPKAKLMLLGGVLFSLGLVTSVATTYAWFQINPLLSVENLNVKINFDTKYELTLDLLGKDGNFVPKDDTEHTDSKGNFTGYTLKDMDFDPENHKLYDVSGMFWEDWLHEEGKDPETILPTFRCNYGPSPGDESHRAKSGEASEKTYGDGKGKGYLQAVFYLTANVDCYVYLTPNSGVKSADTYDSAKFKEKPLEDLQKVTNTIRFSFYSNDGYVVLKQPRTAIFDDNGYPQFGYENIDDNDITYYGGLLDMNGDKEYDCVNGEEALYGQYKGNIQYLPEDEKPADYKGENFNTFNANHRDGVKWVDIERMKNEGQIQKEPAFSIFNYIFDSKKPYRPLESICSLKANEPKRVVFSIYCEGWDKDMTDLVSLASFNFELGFTALIKD